MRYYVYLPPQEDGDGGYILAEVFRESFDDGRYRESSYAAGITGTRSEIVTPDELASQPAGRRALASWQGGDDALADAAEHVAVPILTLVSPAGDDRPAETNG